MDTTFSIGDLSQPNVLDPANIRTGVEWTLLLNIHGTLISEGQNGKFSPRIASSWKIDKLNNEVIFHIDKNAKFSNGIKVTSKDVALTFNYLATQKGTTKYRLGEEFLLKNKNEGIVIIDNDTFKIKTRKPLGTLFPLLSAGDFGILFHKNLDKKGSWEWWEVTSGDYYIDKVTKNLIELKKNQHAYHNGINKLRYVNFDNMLDLKKWYQKSPQTRLIRLMEISELHDIDEKHILHGRPFFVRYIIFPKSNKQNIDTRQAVLSELRDVYKKVTNQKTFQIIPPFFNEIENVLKESKIQLSENKFSLLVSNMGLSKRYVSEIEKQIQSKKSISKFE